MKKGTEIKHLIKDSGKQGVTLTFLVLLLMLSTISCDIVDKSPQGLITDDAVWSDQNLVEAYVLDVYNQSDFSIGTGGNSMFQLTASVMGGENTLFAPWQAPRGLSERLITVENPLSPFFNQFHWANIRRANTIIEQLGKSNLSPEFVNLRSAEVRFLRAYQHFRLVKRYGGMPILTRALPLNAPTELIMVARNTEQEVYDFIANEMDDIIPLLPDINDLGRVNKGTALALKSRALLYAASIAQYGEMKMGGLLGIPSGDAQKYWQASYDASIELINSGVYKLYNENPDPVQNFYDLFHSPIGDNSEAIFGEIFDGSNKGHVFSMMGLPAGPALAWNSNFNVAYEMIEQFDFVDGSSGMIPREEITSREWSSEELFGQRDPRFRASVYYPEIDNILGKTIYFHTATNYKGQRITSGTIESIWPAASEPRNRNRSGAHVRKRVDESQAWTGGIFQSTDYFVFRLGEIYLNLAEAALYLGRTSEAQDALNVLRKRAGMPQLSTVDREIIRKERAVELAFENHRLWDLRRWRIAVEVLDGYRMKGLNYDYMWDSGKYKISFKNVEGVPRRFPPEYYYYPLGIDFTSQNPNMIENPGYE